MRNIERDKKGNNGSWDSLLTAAGAAHWLVVSNEFQSLDWDGIEFNLFLLSHPVYINQDTMCAE